MGFHVMEEYPPVGEGSLSNLGTQIHPQSTKPVAPTLLETQGVWGTNIGQEIQHKKLGFGLTGDYKEIPEAKGCPTTVKRFREARGIHTLAKGNY